VFSQGIHLRYRQARQHQRTIKLGSIVDSNALISSPARAKTSLFIPTQNTSAAMTIHGPLPANNQQKSLEPPNGEVQKAEIHPLSIGAR
jgi:hypothetical protein